MNKTEFIKATAKRAGMTHETAEAIINAALDVATDAISSGQEVKLQRFGTLQVKQRQARGRDFHTGEPLPTRTVKYAHFEPSDGIKAAINGESPAADTDTEHTPALISYGNWVSYGRIDVSVDGTRRRRKIYNDFQRQELYVTFKGKRYYQKDFDME